jgi:cytochrome c-type biogenesis protein CcmE
VSLARSGSGQYVQVYRSNGAILMRKRSQRLWFIGAAGVLMAGAVTLGVIGLSGAVAFFQSPSDIAAKGAETFKQNVRVGGLIEIGSQSHGENGKLLTFRITDCKHTVPVVFDGIPPDMVVEGKGVVAEGRFDADGTLVASRVLAKHDENYMPKEAYDSLKRAAGSEGTMTCGDGAAT